MQSQDGELTLVLGATSLVGRFLTPRAARRGRVAALSRNPPESEGVEWVRGEIDDPTLAERLPGAATVFSLMPLWLLPGALPLLVGGGMRRLVAFSSTSRFTKQASPEPEEREVANRLAEAEATVQETCDRLGIAWTILRPTLIYAEGEDWNVSRLAALVRRFGVAPLSGGGGGLRQPVHAEDLAEAALAAATAEAAVGRAYDLPGADTLSYREMVERIFHGIGRRPRIVRVPPALWRLGLYAARPMLPGATAAMGARMSDDLAFDPEPARRDFGWSPRPFRPVFPDPAEWRATPFTRRPRPPSA